MAERRSRTPWKSSGWSSAWRWRWPWWSAGSCSSRACTSKTGWPTPGRAAGRDDAARRRRPRRTQRSRRRRPSQPSPDDAAPRRRRGAAGHRRAADAATQPANLGSAEREGPDSSRCSCELTAAGAGVDVGRAQRLPQVGRRPGQEPYVFQHADRRRCSRSTATRWRRGTITVNGHDGRPLRASTWTLGAPGRRRRRRTASTLGRGGEPVLKVLKTYRVFDAQRHRARRQGLRGRASTTTSRTCRPAAAGRASAYQRPGDAAAGAGQRPGPAA